MKFKEDSRPLSQDFHAWSLIFELRNLISPYLKPFFLAASSQFLYVIIVGQIMFHLESAMFG